MSIACNPTSAFAAYGIPDAIDLVHRTRYRLLATGDASFQPTAAFLDRVDHAFRAAYIGAADVSLVPEPLHTTLENAAAMTTEEYADVPDAELREEALPSYYEPLVGLFCTYVGTTPEKEVGMWLEDKSR